MHEAQSGNTKGREIFKNNVNVLSFYVFQCTQLLL